MEFIELKPVLKTFFDAVKDKALDLAKNDNIIDGYKLKSKLGLTKLLGYDKIKNVLDSYDIDINLIQDIVFLDPIELDKKLNADIVKKITYTVKRGKKLIKNNISVLKNVNVFLD